jgi:integrase
VSNVDKYLGLADRPNTKRSYESAVRHFEEEWRGLLPTTPDKVADYLATYAPVQAVSTLQTRLAGLSRWHLDHGFQDPTKAPLVRQVMRGIRAAHGAPQRQARPVAFELVERLSDWIDGSLDQISRDGSGRAVDRLRLTRDRSMLLLGFWRGFRSDELTRLRFEHVVVEPGVGMTCFLPRSKGDRKSAGREYPCPALSRLCPVSAFIEWRDASGLVEGPVFRAIDRWGHISDAQLAPPTIVPWLRGLLKAAGVDDTQAYSSHSLRRGFADWARVSGWDIRDLMEYVGWRDVSSALRYLDKRENLADRFERGLEQQRTERPRPTADAPARSGDPSKLRRPTAQVLQLPVRK